MLIFILSFTMKHIVYYYIYKQVTSLQAKWKVIKIISLFTKRTVQIWTVSIAISYYFKVSFEQQD